ncbi:hypothetical protein ACTXT7_010132 [Hymenolepis weldensis]
MELLWHDDPRENNEPICWTKKSTMWQFSWLIFTNERKKILPRIHHPTFPFFFTEHIKNFHLSPAAQFYHHCSKSDAENAGAILKNVS